MGGSIMENRILNDLEAIKLAILIEERGERFYRLSAERVDDPSAKSLLIKLADDETEHRDTFQKLYNEFLNQKEQFSDDYLFDQDVSAYFSAIASSLLFPSEDEQDRIIEELTGVGDVLKFGIQTEKDSILLYTQLVISSKLPEAKDAFRRLLREEKQHLIDLQKLASSIKS